MHFFTIYILKSEPANKSRLLRSPDSSDTSKPWSVGAVAPAITQLFRGWATTTQLHIHFTPTGSQPPPPSKLPISSPAPLFLTSLRFSALSHNLFLSEVSAPSWPLSSIYAPLLHFFPSPSAGAKKNTKDQKQSWRVKGGAKDER